MSPEDRGLSGPGCDDGGGGGDAARPALRLRLNSSIAAFLDAGSFRNHLLSLLRLFAALPPPQADLVPRAARPGGGTSGAQRGLLELKDRMVQTGRSNSAEIWPVGEGAEGPNDAGGTEAETGGEVMHQGV